MIITVDVSGEELVELFKSFQTVSAEDVVNAVERVEDVTRQQLSEQRRTARATMRSARYAHFLGNIEDDNPDDVESGVEFDDGR